MRAHHRALASSQAFWRLLLHHSVRFHDVHAALMHIRKSHMLAQSTYRVVLERYPQSVKLLRAYARFHEEVLVNPGRAAKLYT